MMETQQDERRTRTLEEIGEIKRNALGIQGLEKAVFTRHEYDNAEEAGYCVLCRQPKGRAVHTREGKI